jgi:uncharacterized membrane protein YhfC
VLETGSTTTTAASILPLVTGAGMVAIGLLASLVWRGRTRTPWRFVGLGAAAWAVSVTLKVAWAAPTNRAVLEGLGRLLGESGGTLAGWIYFGLLTGVFEVAFTWLVVRKTSVRQANENEAIAFGVAFGGAEAVALGLISLLAGVAGLLFWDHLPDEVTAALGGSELGWTSALAVFERVFTLVAHLIACVLVVWAVQRRRVMWFWLSFAFKSSLDALAAAGAERLDVKGSPLGLLQLELLLAAYVAVWAAIVYRRGGHSTRMMGAG